MTIQHRRWFLSLVAGSLLGSSLVSMPLTLLAAPASAKAPVASEQVMVNINKATAPELEGIKGIGPMLAERIIKYRDTNGRFERLEDLVHVPGIGPAKYERIKSQITL